MAAVAAAGIRTAADSVWVECRSADGEVRSGPWSSIWSTRVEAAVPWRGFSSYRGQSSFSGWWWSATTGAHVGYESWLERDQLMLLDFDPGVVGICSQPFRLSWRDADGARRRHVPDFFARLADGSGLVVDVRADDRIAERDAAAFEVTRRVWSGGGSGGSGRWGRRCWRICGGWPGTGTHVMHGSSIRWRRGRCSSPGCRWARAPDGSRTRSWCCRGFTTCCGAENCSPPMSSVCPCHRPRR